MYFYFAEQKEDSITILREASDEEVIRINTLNKPIGDMLADIERINSFNRAYKQLFAILQNDNDNPRELAEEIQQKFSHILFEFKKFCDNWETKLAREFGKESKEYKIHKDATAHEYDNHMEYRIMYQLRNYDQHCGSIFVKLNRSLSEDGTICNTPLASRDYLLKNFSKWKAEEKQYLENQEEYIEFLPYAEVLHECIERIQNKTMQIHFNKEFLVSCSQLVCIANEFDNEDLVTLVSTKHPFPEELEGDKTLNFTSINVPLCKRLLTANIIRNMPMIKILYWGKKYNGILPEIAIKIVNQDIVEKLSESQFINIEGQDMIRTNMQVQFDSGDCYFVLADRRMGYSKIMEVRDLYSMYLKALLKI